MADVSPGSYDQPPQAPLARNASLCADTAMPVCRTASMIQKATSARGQSAIQATIAHKPQHAPGLGSAADQRSRQTAIGLPTQVLAGCFASAIGIACGKALGRRRIMGGTASRPLAPRHPIPQAVGLRAGRRSWVSRRGVPLVGDDGFAVPRRRAAAGWLKCGSRRAQGLQAELLGPAPCCASFPRVSPPGQQRWVPLPLRPRSQLGLLRLRVGKGRSDDHQDRLADTRVELRPGLNHRLQLAVERAVLGSVIGVVRTRTAGGIAGGCPGRVATTWGATACQNSRRICKPQVAGSTPASGFITP